VEIWFGFILFTELRTSSLTLGFPSNTKFLDQPDDIHSLQCGGSPSRLRDEAFATSSRILDWKLPGFSKHFLRLERRCQSVHYSESPLQSCDKTLILLLGSSYDWEANSRTLQHIRHKSRLYHRSENLNILQPGDLKSQQTHRRLGKQEN